VERMIEAQGEVERALREPRGAADPAPLRLGEAAPDARG
jgi:hypothetical protein